MFQHPVRLPWFSAPVPNEDVRNNPVEMARLIIKKQEALAEAREAGFTSKQALFLAKKNVI